MRKKNSPTSSPTANKKDRKAGKPGELTAGQNGLSLVLRLSAFFPPLPRSRGRKKKQVPGSEVARPRNRTLLISNVKKQVAEINLCWTVFADSLLLSDHIHG